MDKRMKLVIVGLIGILVVSLLLNLQLTGSRQTAIRERDDLKRENDALAQKVEASIRDSRKLEDKINSLNLDLSRITQEKSEMQSKFDVLNKERQSLIEKLKEQKQVAVQAPAQQLAFKAPASEDAYWAGILRAKTDLEIQLESVRQALREAQISNEQLQREKNSLALEVSTFNREREEFKRQIEYNQKVMDGIAQDLVREKNDKFQIDEMMKAIKNENEALRRQLRNIDSSRNNMEDKFVALQKDNAQLDSRLKEMENILQDRMAQIESLKRQLDAARIGGGPAGAAVPAKPKEAVELPPIVVRPQGSSGNVVAPDVSGTSSTAGKILAINKDNNFVVIDLGFESGIKEGDIVQVYRDNDIIARLEVIQVRDKISACDIKKEVSPVKIGDTVK